MKEKELPLAELLLLKSKQQLASIAKNLHIKISKSSRKEDLIKTLSNYILMNPHAVLMKLNRDNLLRLQQLIQAPKHRIYLPKYEFVQDELTRIGLAGNHCNKNNLSIYLCPNLTTIFAPLIDSFIENTKNNERYFKEQFVLGLINLYGIITLKDVEVLYKEYDSKITFEELRQLIDESFLLSSIYHEKFERFKECFVSHFIEFPEIIIEERRVRKLPRYTNFTKDEILRLGHSFCPIPPYPKMTQLKKLFTNLGYSPIDTNYIISSLWSISNNMNSSEPNNDGLLFFKPGKNKNIDETLYLDVVTDYMSDIPKWILHGSSAAQLFRIFFANYVPSEELDGIIKLNEKESFQIINEHIAAMSNTTEEDRLCPCGSGKKFKVCCGNN